MREHRRDGLVELPSMLFVETKGGDLVVNRRKAL